MKARISRGTHRIHHYQVGDLLLEVDRTIPNPPVILNTRGGAPPNVSPEAVEAFLKHIKAQSEEYPAVKEVLQFFKFSPEDVEAYYQSISTAITMAAGCVTIVGAVIAVIDLVSELFGPAKEDESLKYLKHISQRVDQIYGYLAEQDKRGLFNETIAWRGDLENVRNAVKNARTSRSPENLKALGRLKPALDSNLIKMLDPRSANIAFQRSTYGYSNTGGYTDTGHWIDSAVSPFITLSDGTPIPNYSDPGNNLQATIWDPGHYVDMLAGCLTDRLLLVAVTEPAFRSTNYDRKALENLLDGLTLFLNKWRGSLMVANPLIGLNGGGRLQHPRYQAPMGVPIGAVDPVTGISFFNSTWLEGGWSETTEGSAKAKGTADYSHALDPMLAHKRALELQPRFLEAAIRASGIARFVEFRSRLQDVLARYSTGSDFVDLPNATFNLVQMNGPAAQVESVSLGFVGKYSDNPDKQYQGTRYTQTLEKRFRFAMALRADVSLIQLGYRMEVGGRSISLIPFSVAPGDGEPVARFPTHPISHEIRIDDFPIYDVYQSTLFSEADEDRFEGVEPPSHPGNFQINQTKFFPGQRIFLNERRGPIALRVDVAFETDLNNLAQPFVGHANVTISNIDPVSFPGGIILPVAVHETRVGADDHPEEVPADSMTIHIAPSFLVVGNEYFDDRREGLEKMNQIFGGLNEKFAISVQPGLPIGPEWQVRRRVVEEAAKDKAITRILDAEPEVAQSVVRRFMPPIPVRSHHG